MLLIRDDQPDYAGDLPVMHLSSAGCLQDSRASKAKPGANKKPAAAAKKKKKSVVLSSSGASEEEEEEEATSEDESERLEIERVLDGRPNAESKQEEFLVKFKGDMLGQTMLLPLSCTLDCTTMLLPLSCTLYCNQSILMSFALTAATSIRALAGPTAHSRISMQKAPLCTSMHIYLLLSPHPAGASHLHLM